MARAGGQVAWTRDSTRFAYTANDGLHVVQLRGLRNRRVSATASLCGVAWSPDGRSLASVDTTRGLVVVRGARARTLTVARGASGCLLAWSPDGKWIAVAGSANRVAGPPNPGDATVVSVDETTSSVIVGDFPSRVTTTVYRAEQSGCPCPALRTDPGPLYLDDADAGGILAHGSNAIVVLDSSGARLLSIANPVPPTYYPSLTARLAGNDLVVLLEHGELRDYDAATGALRHDWTLPGVPYQGLQDAARGLAAYVGPGGVGLVGLSDGAPAAVAPGSSAAFTDAGLVYADGARIHFVPLRPAAAPLTLGRLSRGAAA